MVIWFFPQVHGKFVLDHIFGHSVKSLQAHTPPLLQLTYYYLLQLFVYISQFTRNINRPLNYKCLFVYGSFQPVRKKRGASWVFICPFCRQPGRGVYLSSCPSFGISSTSTSHTSSVLPGFVEKLCIYVGLWGALVWSALQVIKDAVEYITQCIDFNLFILLNLCTVLHPNISGRFTR